MGGFRPYVDRLLERLTDQPTALVHDGRTTSGAEHVQLVYRLARALERRGLARGHRMVILTANTPEVVATRHAAHLLGCAVAVLPVGRGGEATARFVDHVGPQALVVCPQALEAVPDVLDLVAPTELLSLGPVAGASDLLAIAAKESVDPMASPAQPADLGCIFGSGGTTGAAKGSCHTFGSYTATVTDGADDGPRLLVATPLAYLAQVLVDQALTAGGQVVLLDRYDAAAVVRQIEEHRITHLFLVEPLLFDLIEHPALAAADISSLEWLLHIGASAPPSRLLVALHRLGPVLCHAYGSSEAGLVTVLPPRDLDPSRPELLQTSGRPLPWVSLQIRDPAGRPLPTGQLGDIWVRSPRITTGYWHQPQLTAELLHAGWLHTGDVGCLDAEGYLRMMGRRRDLISVNGSTVFPSQVEDALYAHRGVRAAAAFNQPTASGQPRLVAVVVPRTGAWLTAAALGDHVRGRLGKAYVPKVIALADHFPVTDQGKPDLPRLRELVG